VSEEKHEDYLYGYPEFAVPALERLVGGGYEVTAVYTQPDKARDGVGW